MARLSSLKSLADNRAGAAASEMALVMPLLIILIFGLFEIGKYFLDEHVVVKAVRDGARFAGRQDFADMPCGAASTAETQIKNLVRFGNVAGTGTPRLDYWDDPATITVTTDCPALGAYSGIYKNMASTPRVTVSATVPYQALLGTLGFDAASVTVTARSQAAVMGL